MKPLKVFSVIRTYGRNQVLDIVIARDEEEVYRLMLWEKKDKPLLEIKELPRDKPACVLSRHLADTYPPFRK
jgi:hypothetical protein